LIPLIVLFFYSSIIMDYICAIKDDFFIFFYHSFTFSFPVRQTT